MSDIYYQDHTYGAIKAESDERDYTAKEHITLGVRPKTYLPKKLAPIKNQGAVGACVAFSIATSVWYQENDEKKSEMEYSHDFIYHNRKDTDYQGYGMITREACANYCDCGVATLNDLPTNTEYPNINTKAFVNSLKEKAKKTVGLKYIKCDNLDELADAIYQYKAGLLSIEVRSSFDSFWLRTKKTWVLPIPEKNERHLGYHCVCAIGYNDDGIIIQNSWGKNWGYNGLAVVPWDYPIDECRAIIDERKIWDIISFTIGVNYMSFNNKLSKLDTAPIIKNKRTFVPIRCIFEVLDAQVLWLPSTKTIIINKDNDTVSLQINNKIAYKNDTPINLDVAPFIKDNRTFVPLRFISEVFGADVEWIEHTQEIIIRREVK